jgi:hypothetical protein
MLLDIPVDSAKLVLARIVQLQDLIIKYHAQENTWFKVYGQPLIALGIVIVTIGGQLLIFRLTKRKEIELFKINRRKEIEIKVAELYAKYKSSAVRYVITFLEYNTSKASHKVSTLYLEELERRINDPQEWSHLSEEERNALLNNQKSVAEDIDTKYKLEVSNYEKFKQVKSEIHEQLHQIHFYYKDQILENLINELHKVKVYKIEETQLTPEMAKADYPTNFLKNNIEPLTMAITKISNKITNRIITLSKE